MAAQSAAAANTAQVGDVATALEDIDQIIRRITPSDAPLFNLCPTVDATHVLTQWEVEELPTARNEAEEVGYDANDEAPNANTLLSNNLQLHSRTGRVSHTAQAVATAGGVSDLIREITKKSLAQRNDIELMALTNTPTTAGATPVSAGLATWISNGSVGGSGSLPAGTGAGAATPGTQRALTLTQIEDAMQACFEDGGNPSIAIVGATVRRNFSALTGVNTNQVNLSANNDRLQEAQIIGSVSSFLTDFGQIDLVLDRHMNGARTGSPAFGTVETMYLVDPDYLDFAFLPGMKFRYFELGKSGSSDRFAIESQVCIRPTAPKAHGVVHAVNA